MAGRPVRNVRANPSNPYGAGAYVNIDEVDFDGSDSDDSSSSRQQPAKRRPGRPRKDDTYGGTPTGRRTYTSETSGMAGIADPYDEISVTRPFSGMVLYNSEKKARLKNHHLYFTRSELEECASLPVKLVPIRIDFDIDNFHLSDTFLWNVNETLITPEHFAHLLLADVMVPGPRGQPRRVMEKTTMHAQLVQSIVAQIRAQCAAYVPAVAEDPEGAVVPDEPLVQRTEPDEEPSPGEAEERKTVDHASDTLRVVIRLDLIIGNTHLRDKFEYPLSPSSTKVTPEVFARILCADMALGPEFVPSIAHSIREQLVAARIAWEDEMQAPEVGRHGFRMREDDWEPIIKDLTDSDLVKLTRERDRNPRRNRRGGRRGYALSAVPSATPTYPLPVYRPSPLNPVHKFGGTRFATPL
ncbi:hypothetical protein DFJ74DRAFT_660474 [Hyaloraphidium curvatum]|nr:hypothetical protein DFJ74DRAFT_660474 [Hyaloraphidium curvatum]